MKDKMRIGEFAEQAGVTPRTIRYYEDLGLLGPNEREGQGFRYYTSTELATLKKDRLAQTAWHAAGRDRRGAPALLR
jgi:DNA-binding transcriptional MerR regulator